METVEGFKLIKEFPGFKYKVGDLFVKTSNYAYGSSHMGLKFEKGSMRLEHIDSKIKLTEGEFFKSIKINISCL